MKGGCLCGAVQYRLEGFNGRVYQCHCRLCRKQGGSSSNTGALVPLSQLTWRNGQKFIRTWKKGSGFTSSFCVQCGSPVPNRLRDFPVYWIPVGCLEGGDFEVVANFCLDSKASWATVSPEGRCYSDLPDLPEVFAQLGLEPG